MLLLVIVILTYTDISPTPPHTKSLLIYQVGLNIYKLHWIWPKGIGKYVPIPMEIQIGKGSYILWTITDELICSSFFPPPPLKWPCPFAVGREWRNKVEGGGGGWGERDKLPLDCPFIVLGREKRDGRKRGGGGGGEI